MFYYGQENEGKLGKTIMSNINIYCKDINWQVEAKKKGWGSIYIWIIKYHQPKYEGAFLEGELN